MGWKTTVQMSILWKLVHRLNMIPVKILAGFLKEIDDINDDSKIYMEMKIS